MSKIPTDAFIRVPKAIMTNERDKKLSAEAKLLYALMDDRMRLSAVNGWHDENGEVFINFTINEVCLALPLRESLSRGF